MALTVFIVELSNTDFMRSRRKGKRSLPIYISEYEASVIFLATWLKMACEKKYTKHVQSVHLYTMCKLVQKCKLSKIIIHVHTAIFSAPLYTRGSHGMTCML